jgi:hypothetical protein
MNIGINTSNVQSEFITKYGSYASQFTALNALGHQRNNYYVVVSILAFVFMIAMLVVTKEKIDPITNKPLEKSTFDNILNYVKYFSIIVFLGSLGFNGYMYFIVYLPQYYKWFKMLPDAAKAELITINTLNSVIEHARQNPTHGTLGLGNGLINIRL